MTRQVAARYHSSVDTKVKREKDGATRETTENFGQSKDDMTCVNEKLAQLTKTIEKYITRIEEQDKETVKLKKEVAELKSGNKKCKEEENERKSF